MGAMFNGAFRFNQDISRWDVSSVTNMSFMFAVPSGVDSPDGPADFNQDIGNWDVSNVTGMSGMFEKATAFNQDLTPWVVADVTECAGFSRDSGLVAANLPNFTNCNPE